MSDCCSYSAIIRNKLYIHSGLYIYFVQNIRNLHSYMIQFHTYEIKLLASHFTPVIKRHAKFSKSISSPAHHASVICPELEQIFSKSPCRPQNCRSLPILSVIMETNISSFSFLLEVFFQQCAQQVTALYDFKQRFNIKMQPNHNANIQVCRFSILIFLNLILLHVFYDNEI